MKQRFKDNMIKKIVEDTMVLYDTNSGAYYGVRGALKQYFMEHDEFEEVDIIDYLVQHFGVERTTAIDDVVELLSDFEKSEIIEVVR